MNSEFFKVNRSKLMEALEDDLVVIAAYTKMQGTADGAAPFGQESNFWWLSGVSFADWWLIIDGRKQKSWLVTPTLSDSQWLFDGGLAPDVAGDISGVDDVISHDDAMTLLGDLKSSGHRTVYTLGESRLDKSADYFLNPAGKRLRNVLKKTFVSVEDCRKELSRLRAIKQPIEREMMHRAAAITVETFREVSSKLTDYHHEYELEAELAYSFRRRGAKHAFEPIVAAGRNACTLHYVDNSSDLHSGQFVLIDAGARLGMYPADVTRTFAIGEPTGRQIEVHAAVQAAEKRIIELLKPGIKIKDYVESADAIMEDALLSLDLIKSRHDEDGFRRYFPHAVSHGLGVDVHESLGGYEEFCPGMVLTVEPGIYIPEESIGVRIEDDIIITDTGNESLTGDLSTDF